MQLQYYVHVRDMVDRCFEEFGYSEDEFISDVNSTIVGHLPVVSDFESAVDALYRFNAEVTAELIKEQDDDIGSKARFPELRDEDGNIRFTDVETLVSGVAKEPQQGYTVYSTGFGLVMILP